MTAKKGVSGKRILPVLIFGHQFVGLWWMSPLDRIGSLHLGHSLFVGLFLVWGALRGKFRKNKWVSLSSFTLLLLLVLWSCFQAFLIMIEGAGLDTSIHSSLAILYSFGITLWLIRFRYFGKNKALKGKRQLVMLHYLAGTLLLLALEGALYLERNIYVLWTAMLVYVFLLLEQFSFLVKKEVSRIL